MSNKKRKLESPSAEGKKKVKPNPKEAQTLTKPQPTSITASQSASTTANKLSKKKERRKLFKKEVKNKLRKEKKLGWNKKKKAKTEANKTETPTEETTTTTKTKTTTQKMEVVSQVAPPKNPREMSANWKALQEVMQRENGPKKTKKKTGKTGGKLSERGKTTTTTTAASAKKPTVVDGKAAKENESASRPAKPEIWFELDDENLLERSTEDADLETATSTSAEVGKEAGSASVTTPATTGLTEIVGLDCEMVGVGEGGVDSILARVSIVNQYGHPVYDKYVKPTETVSYGKKCQG